MATAFKIEKGIPAPPKSRGGTPKYPFADLNPGDSFFVPASELPPSGRHTVMRAAANHASRHKVSFACRSVDGGVRVWRIA